MFRGVCRRGSDCTNVVLLTVNPILSSTGTDLWLQTDTGQHNIVIICTHNNSLKKAESQSSDHRGCTVVESSQQHQVF